MRSEGVKRGERFRSGGVATGVTGLLVLGAAAAYGLLSEDADCPAWVWPTLAALAVLVWLVLVRPAVVLRPGEVELVNVLHRRVIPVGRISEVAVGQVTVIVTDDGARHVCSGLGRTRRQIRRDARGVVAQAADAGADRASADQVSLGRLIEDRIRREAHDAAPGAGEVRVLWSIPEIVVLGLLVLGAVVAAAAT